MEVSSLHSASPLAPPRRSLLPKPLWLQSDEGLVTLVRLGNEAAFEQLVKRYRTRLLAFCRQMVRSEPDAEDLLQETFTAAFRAIHADTRDIHVKPWLYRIARNRCLNHLRDMSAAQSNGDHRDGVLDESPAGWGPSVAERAARREELRLLVKDILELPETQRSALVLHELHGLSYDDVAGAMSTTVPSVKSLLVRARVGLVNAAEARELTCDEVRLQLTEVDQGLRELSAAARAHVKRCGDCRAFKLRLRTTSKSLAALAPIWPLITVKAVILGKVSPGATAAAAGAGGSSVGVSTGAAALITKTAVGLATVTALTTTVPDMTRVDEPRTGGPVPITAPTTPLPLQAPVGAPSEGGRVPGKVEALGQPGPAAAIETPAPAPAGRIVGSTPDVVSGITDTRDVPPVDAPSEPRTRPAPDGVAMRRTRPEPGAPSQTDSPPAPATGEGSDGALFESLDSTGSEQPPPQQQSTSPGGEAPPPQP